jgi:hypothetical protein
VLAKRKEWALHAQSLTADGIWNLLLQASRLWNVENETIYF